jgi:hypothetical protein
VRPAGEWAFTIAGLRPQGGARAYASEDETLNAYQARLVEVGAAAGVEPLRLPEDTHDLGQRFDQGEQLGDVVSVPRRLGDLQPSAVDVDDQVAASRRDGNGCTRSHSPSGRVPQS